MKTMTSRERLQKALNHQQQSMKVTPSLLCCLLTCGIHAAAAPNHDELWDMMEVRKQPLDVEMIGAPRKAPLVAAEGGDWMNTGDAWVAKKKAVKAAAPKPATSNEQLLVEELFLSSESTPQGPNRIFCAVARPEEAAGPVPVVLIFHGGGGHASGALALAAARRHPGMAGVALDYNGQLAPGPKGKVTQWNNVPRDRKFDLVPNLRNWPMYHNVIAERRTIDFIETQPRADKSRIGVVGISHGGWVALMLAGVDERVKCVTTGVASQHEGLRLRMHGNGEAGKLTVTLLRDTNGLDERAYTAEIAYAADCSDPDVPWSECQLTTKNVTAPPMPCPFDGLEFFGSRESGTAVTIESVTFGNMR